MIVKDIKENFTITIVQGKASCMIMMVKGTKEIGRMTFIKDMAFNIS